MTNKIDKIQEEKEFQIELLKIHLGLDWRMSWFFAIFGNMFTLLSTFPKYVYIIGPLFTGFIFLFISFQSQWKDEKILKLQTCK